MNDVHWKKSPTLMTGNRKLLPYRGALYQRMIPISRGRQKRQHGWAPQRQGVNISGHWCYQEAS